MKTIIAILVLLSISFNIICADNIDYIKNENGIILIGSESSHGNLKRLTSAFFTSYMTTYTAKNDELVYNLELYSNGKNKQFALKIYLWSSSKKPRILPSKSQILLKTNDDSVLELTSIFNDIDYEHGYSYSYFPISEDDLNKTFDGIKKVRLEAITLNTNNETSIEFIDFNFKKDKIGQSLKKWFDSINEEYPKICNTKIVDTNNSDKDYNTNIKDGF